MSHPQPPASLLKAAGLVADRLVVIGDCSAVPHATLSRLGYSVTLAPPEVPLVALIEKELFDLAIVAGNDAEASVEYVEFLRASDTARQIPCLVLVRAAKEEVELQRFDKVVTITTPCRAGLLAGRVATLLRMRKLAGGDSETASLGEMNAALRDLTQRFGKELEEARKIQQGLLPQQLPKDPRYDVAASYEPLEEVGGDWYSLVAAGDKLSIHIADVTGHGLAAAFICTMTKLAISVSGHSSPGAHLERINELLALHVPEGRFITMGYVDYDVATGEMQHARAGHPPALLLEAATSSFRPLTAGGVPLGFMAGSQYSEERATLAPGDAILVYTDGITEAQNRANEQFGTERLGAALVESAAKPNCAEMLRHIFLRFNEFRDGRRLKDDVSLVVLRRASV